MTTNNSETATAAARADALFAVDADELTDLGERLARDADRLGLFDVFYRTVDSPIGRLLLAGTERGLLRVAFEREDFDAVLDVLAERVGPRILRGTGRLDDTARQLDDYFRGRRQTFDLALDDRLSAGFRRVVRHYLPLIGYGHTATYKQVAESVGNPYAVRAVGSACATNPLPLVVPCHRVVRSDGSLGGYAGGVEAKAALLTMERAA